MITENQAEIIATRRHERLQRKHDIFKLIHQSYQGGTDYINTNNLFQYTIEDNFKYSLRLKRASYNNHTQQLINMMHGFIHTTPVKREINSSYQYVLDSIFKGKPLQSLMDVVCINSFKNVCGVLVDSPANLAENLTRADRINNKINPYAVFYNYDKILDFELDDKGELNWITLDNSYTDKSDPLSPGQLKVVIRLWTKDYYADIQAVKVKDKVKYTASEEVLHKLGKVPFIFCNAKDSDNDNISDSMFEDIAIKSRKIFNVTSWMDEALVSSSFKLLFMPYENQEDVDAITKIFNPADGGMSDVPVIPFKATSQKPTFDGPGITDNVDNYIKAINLEAEGILNFFGLKSESKGSWESGVAKSIDFSKTEAILKATSQQMQQIEKQIIDLCSLYEGSNIDYKIEYSFSYEKSDLDKELTRLQSAFIIPSQTVQKKAYIESAKLIFNELTPEEIKQIEADTATEDTSPSAPNYI